MDRVLARACYDPRQRLVWGLGILFFFLVSLLGLGLFVYGRDPFSGFVAFAMGGFALLGLKNLARAPCYALCGGCLIVGWDAVPLEAVLGARFAVRPSFFYPGGEPGLWLWLKNGRRLWLSAYPAGWDRVWRALAERRPDLGVPDWRKEPRLREALAHAWQSGVALPEGGRVVCKGLFAGVLLAGGALLLAAGAAAALVGGLSGLAPGARYLVGPLAAGLGVPLAFFVYERVAGCRLRVEGEG